MDNNDKLIQEQLKAIPLEVREAIERVPWKDRLKNIAKRENLNADKSTSLETETMFILYGFLPPAEYPDNLTRELGLDEETADRIVKQVSDDIFADIEKQYEMIDATTHAPQVKTPVPTPTPAPTPPPPPVAPKPQLPPQSSTPAPSEIKMYEVNKNLPEVMPGQTAHKVMTFEVKTDIKPAQAPTPQAPAPVPTPPPPSTIKPNLVNIPRYGEAPQSVADEAPKRPPLELPKSDYVPGQDPYHEPLE